MMDMLQTGCKKYLMHIKSPKKCASKSRKYIWSHTNCAWIATYHARTGPPEQFWGKKAKKNSLFSTIKEKGSDKMQFHQVSIRIQSTAALQWYGDTQHETHHFFPWYLCFQYMMIRALSMAFPSTTGPPIECGGCVFSGKRLFLLHKITARNAFSGNSSDLSATFLDQKCDTGTEILNA